MPVPVVDFTLGLEEELMLVLAVVHTLVQVVANTLVQVGVSTLDPAAVNTLVLVGVSTLDREAELMLDPEAELTLGRVGLAILVLVAVVTTNGTDPTLTANEIPYDMDVFIGFDRL